MVLHVLTTSLTTNLTTREIGSLGFGDFMKTSRNRAIHFLIVLLLGALPCTTAKAFDAGLDQRELHAQEVEIARLHEKMGDEGFLSFAVGELDTLANIRSNRHPRFGQRVLQRGTAEQLWTTRKLFYLALLPELKKLNDERAMPVLSDILALRVLSQKLSGGSDHAAYFGSSFFNIVADTYLSLGVKHRDPLPFLLEYAQQFGSAEPFSFYLDKGREVYGGVYPDDALLAFVKAYTELLLTTSNVSAWQLASNREVLGQLGFEPLREMAELGGWSQKLMALMIMAYQPRFFRDTRDTDAAERDAATQLVDPKKVAWFDAAVMDEYVELFLM